MKLNNGKRLTVVATFERKADVKDTINTLRAEGMIDMATLINSAIESYNSIRKICNVDKSLGKLGLQNAIETEMIKITDLNVQTLAKMINNAGSVNDYLFNVISANTFTMDKNNDFYFSMKETIIPNDTFIEQVTNPEIAVKIGTVDFKGQNFINFGTEHIKQMVTDNKDIPESVKKTIIKLCDKPELALFEEDNQNKAFKESLRKFETVVSNFESTLKNVCRLSETGEFVSITGEKVVTVA
ncbi:MAG: hypothetical protein RR744_00140 [Cellulosilyticaceae bacterium]